MRKLTPEERSNVGPIVAIQGPGPNENILCMFTGSTLRVWASVDFKSYFGQDGIKTDIHDLDLYFLDEADGFGRGVMLTCFDDAWKKTCTCQDGGKCFSCQVYHLKQRAEHLSSALQHAKADARSWAEQYADMKKEHDRWLKRMQMLEHDLLKIKAVVAPETIGPVSREILSRKS